MILEDHIDILRKATDLLIYQQEKKQLQINHPELTTDNIKLKDKLELQPRYHFLPGFAQKVLTQDPTTRDNNSSYKLEMLDWIVSLLA